MLYGVFQKSHSGYASWGLTTFDRALAMKVAQRVFGIVVELPIVADFRNHLRVKEIG